MAITHIIYKFKWTPKITQHFWKLNEYFLLNSEKVKCYKGSIVLIILVVWIIERIVCGKQTNIFFQFFDFFLGVRKQLFPGKKMNRFIGVSSPPSRSDLARLTWEGWFPCKHPILDTLIICWYQTAASPWKKNESFFPGEMNRLLTYTRTLHSL